MTVRSLPGFKDFYPEDMAVRRAIEAAWHRASRAAGFQEWDGPTLEPLALFTAKSGEEITDQLYAFEDRGGRAVALRPEMTPSLARVVAARAGGLPKPIKWYCLPQFFRYERPQRGRLREFYQWNVDVIGSSELAADAEVMTVAIEALQILGLGSEDVVLRVNDRRFLHRMLLELEIGPEDHAETMGWIDKIERDPRVPELLTERLGDSRARELLGWCSDFPLDRAEELGALLVLCQEYGLADFVEPDFKIVRGLAYYTGPVWEIFGRGGDLRSVAGGGRYDGLIAQLGGPDLPALGFGMGDAVLLELLKERDLLPEVPPRVEAVVVPIGAEMLGPAREVARRLRSSGVSTEVPYTAVRVGKALRAADQAGARRVFLVGPDEWKDGRVVVRDLQSGAENATRLDEI